MLTEPTAAGANDLFLLTAATKALRLLSHPDKPYSYCTRLHKNFTWCTEIATLIYNSRKSALPDPIRTGSGIFENNASGAFDPFNFTQNDTSAQIPAIKPSTTHDFEGDFRMDAGSHVAKSGPNSHPMNAVSSSANPSDFGCFQDSLNTDMFNINGLASKADDFTDLLTQPVEMPPESSAQFQDALRWVFDKGSGLDSSFQQIMTDQGMPVMPFGKDATYSV